MARLEYNQSQRIMAEKTVRSPVSGIVVERAMSPGEYRGADASHILTIAQVDPLNVEVFAPIAQLDAVKLGDESHDHPGGAGRAASTSPGSRSSTACSTRRAALSACGSSCPIRGNRLPAGLRCRIEFKSAARAREAARHPPIHFGSVQR